MKRTISHLFNLIQKSFSDIWSLYKKHRFNPLLYLWLYLTINVFKKLVILYILLHLWCYTKAIFRILKSNDITLDLEKYTDIIEFGVYNLIGSKKNYFEIAVVLSLRWTFFTVVGSGARVIKISINFFDIIFTEITEEKVLEKKFKIKIIKFFVRRVFSRFLLAEINDLIFFISFKNSVEITVARRRIKIKIS